MKNIILSILFTTFIGSAEAQKDIPIKFWSQYVKKTDSDNVKLMIENLSSAKTYYYSVGVEGLTDTGWVGLNADINSLGMNEFLTLKPIRPKSQIVKAVSKSRIFFLYKYHNIIKIRFGITYFEKNDFNSRNKSIFLPSMMK